VLLVTTSRLVVQTHPSLSILSLCRQINAELELPDHSNVAATPLCQCLLFLVLDSHLPLKGMPASAMASSLSAVIFPKINDDLLLFTAHSVLSLTAAYYGVQYYLGIKGKHQTQRERSWVLTAISRYVPLNSRLGLLLYKATIIQCYHDRLQYSLYILVVLGRHCL
jgi:hypothetical protein